MEDWEVKGIHQGLWNLWAYPESISLRSLQYYELTRRCSPLALPLTCDVHPWSVLCKHALIQNPLSDGFLPKRSLRMWCFHRCLFTWRGGRGLCPSGGLCPEGGSLSRRGGLCPGGSLSREGLYPRGSMSRGRSLSSGVSVRRSGCLSGRAPYCKERAERILLECILVNFLHFRDRLWNFAQVAIQPDRQTFCM